MFSRPKRSAAITTNKRIKQQANDEVAPKQEAKKQSKPLPKPSKPDVEAVKKLRDEPPSSTNYLAAIVKAIPELQNTFDTKRRGAPRISNQLKMILPTSTAIKTFEYEIFCT